MVNLHLQLIFITELTAAYLSSNVDGSMLGNSFSATGRSSSMKGTTMNTANGTSRRRSCVVRFNCSAKNILAFGWMWLKISCLPSLSPRERISVQNLPLQASGDAHLGHEQLRPVPVVRGLMLYFFPGPS
jgi:hypothetical protein